MELQTVHRMRRTDRLETLSAIYHIPVCMIMRANSFACPQDLFLCREVKIPKKCYCNRCGHEQRQSVHYEAYTIKPSDTLYGIAKTYGLTMHIILRANGISDPAAIRPGDRLNIPLLSGVLYCVRPGDTVADIAKRLGSSERSVREKNYLGHNDAVFAGMHLLV